MPRILLVDDDIAEISAVKRVLARSGHQPVLATNASDALAAIGQAPPDLLVVGSTCENGEALAMAARVAAGDAGVPPMPIVVLGEAAGSPAGAAVVARPIDPSQLGQEVTRALVGASPREPPAPARRTQSAPVGKIAPARVPAPGGAQTVPAAPAAKAPAAPAAKAPPPPAAKVPPPAASAKSPARATSPSALAAGARPPRASPPPRHDAPAAAPRAALSVEVTAALEPVSRRDAPGAQSASPALPQPGARARASLPRPGVLVPPPPPPAPAPAPPDEASARRAAAAEALRARAEELRRGRPLARPSKPISEEVVDDELDALLDRVEERPAAELAAELAAGLPELEPEPVAAPPPRPAAPRPAPPRPEARAVRHEAPAPREDVQPRRREEEAEARAAAEALAAAGAANRRLEEEVEALRRQMEQERREAEDRLARERERAEASSAADVELDRLAEEQARDRAQEEARLRDEQEAELRRAVESARADMEALRRKHDEEAIRRAELEAELARLTEEGGRRAAGPAPTPAPLAYAFPEPPIAPPPLDAAEDEARRRAAARRDSGWSDAAAAPEAPELPPQPPALPPPELRSGAVADLAVPRLLALAWKARMGGRLDFQGAASRSLYLEGGRIVGATSAEPSERLEELALRLGLVTREQYRQVAAAAAALPARRAALLLLERGFLKPNELTGLVRRRAEEIVSGLVADESARFRWVGAEVPPDERVGLDRGTLALAVEGVRRRWLASRIEPVLGGDATLLAPVQGGPSPAELGLSAEERKAVALADGLRTLDEIEAASPLDPLSTRQILCALVLVGALAVRVLGAGRAAGLSAAAIDLARVREKLDQVRRADYFTILGVGRMCTPHEVREAAERLTAEFAPARFQGVREEGLPGRLEEIVGVVSDAREVLADERLREEYLKGLGD